MAAFSLIIVAMSGISVSVFKSQRKAFVLQKHSGKYSLSFRINE